MRYRDEVRDESEASGTINRTEDLADTSTEAVLRAFEVVEHFGTASQRAASLPVRVQLRLECIGAVAQIGLLGVQPSEFQTQRREFLLNVRVGTG